MMKASELRDLNDDQLASMLRDTGENLFRLRVQAGSEKLITPSELKRCRRLIARIKTIQKERRSAPVEAETIQPVTADNEE